MCQRHKELGYRYTSTYLYSSCTMCTRSNGVVQRWAAPEVINSNQDLDYKGTKGIDWADRAIRSEQTQQSSTSKPSSLRRRPGLQVLRTLSFRATNSSQQCLSSANSIGPTEAFLVEPILINQVVAITPSSRNALP